LGDDGRDSGSRVVEADGAGLNISDQRSEVATRFS
jgi:hypothetical protein